MRTLDDKTWFIEGATEFRGTITFTAAMSFMPNIKIPFEQSFIIRETLRRDIYTQVFGHMPQTCRTTMRHLADLERALREKGEVRLANKAAVTKALVDSLLDQMTPPIEKMEDVEENFLPLR